MLGQAVRLHERAAARSPGSHRRPLSRARGAPLTMVQPLALARRRPSPPPLFSATRRRFSFAMKAEEEERPPKMKKLSPAWRKIN